MTVCNSPIFFHISNVFLYPTEDHKDLGNVEILAFCANLYTILAISSRILTLTPIHLSFLLTEWFVLEFHQLTTDNNSWQSVKCFFCLLTSPFFIQLNVLAPCVCVQNRNICFLWQAVSQFCCWKSFMCKCMDLSYVEILAFCVNLCIHHAMILVLPHKVAWNSALSAQILANTRIIEFVRIITFLPQCTDCCNNNNFEEQ